MRIPAVLGVSLASLVLGCLIGYAARGDHLPAVPTTHPRPGASAPDESLRQRVLDLEAQLASEMKSKDELKARLLLAAEANAAGKPAARRERAPGPGITLASTADADPIFEEALKVADLDAIFALGAALLAMGDEGFEKALSLLERFHKEGLSDGRFDSLLEGELYAGRFFQTIAANHENLIRLALYVSQKESGNFPGLHNLHYWLSFYDGTDPEIDAGCLPLIQKEIERTPDATPDTRTLRSLAALGSDDATDLLTGLLAEAPPDRLQEVVTALWYQGNPRALPALKSVRVPPGQERLRVVVEGAILALEARI